VAPVGLQTTVALEISTLTAAGLKQALEALPAVGAGNVAVTLSSGVFTITFIGFLAGGALPRLLVNNFTASPAPTTTIATAGGGTLTVSGSISGTSSLRKERKGRLTLGGDNSNFAGTIVVNEGELVAGHINALGSIIAGTTVA